MRCIEKPLLAEGVRTAPRMPDAARLTFWAGLVQRQELTAGSFPGSLCVRRGGSTEGDARRAMRAWYLDALFCLVQ